MTHNTATFTNVEDLAIFCAALTKQGIAFRCFDKGGEYLVEITGY